MSQTSPKFSHLIFVAFLLSIFVSNTLLGNDYRKWIVATEADYPPFSYTEDGEIKGYNRAIVDEIAKTMQLDVEVQIAPWNEIRSKLESGEIDAIVGMYYSPERDHLVDFSPPIFTVTHAVFSRSEVPMLKDESELEGKKVCVMKGDIMHDYMLQRHPDSELLFCDTIKEGLERLQKGELDYVLMARIPSLYWLSQLHLHNVHESPFLIRPSRYCLAVQEKDAEFLALLEEGLTTIELNGRKRAIRDEWLSPLDTHSLDLKTVLHWGLLTIGPLIILLLLILLWTIVLRKIIAKRTSELKDSREYYKTTLESIGDAVITTDHRGFVTGMNSVAEQLTEWKNDDARGLPLVEVFDIVNALSGEKVENPVEKVISSGFIVGLANHTKIIGKKGSERQISDSASPIRDQSGNIVGVVLIFRDVTEEYEWQQKIADSEASLKSIYDNMSEGLCYHELVYDESGNPRNYRILGVNPSYERILSLSKEEVVGKLATEAYKVEKPPFFDTFVQVIESGEPTTFEVDFTPLGKQFCISAFCSESGRFATIFSDITERKNREQRMDEINSILRTVRTVNQLIAHEKDREKLLKEAAATLVDNRDFHHCWISLNEQPSHEAMFVLNPENPALEKPLRQLTRNGTLHCIESYDKDLSVNLINRPHIECNGCPMSSIYEGQHGICSALSYQGKHYGYISASPKTRILTPEDDEARLFRELADDLSFALFNIEVIEQEEKNRKQLIQAKETAEAANRAKDDFLAMMSHELRTPLNPIVGYSSLIKEEIESDEIRGYLDIILQSTERELELIDDILSYTRLDRNSFEPKWSEFSLFEVCESAIDDVREISHGLQLSFSPDTKDGILNPNLKVKGEKNMLLRILDNLLGNACKYTPEGSIELILKRDLSDPQCTKFTFEVWDTGIGLEQKQIDSIFEPFTQVDSTYTREFEGVGLGLSICKKLIEFLGGTKGVESTLGKGSCFRFTVPLEIVEDVPKKAATQRPKTNQSLVEWNKSVLLVEDNEENIGVTCAIFKKLQIQYFISRNGIEALHLSKLRKYDAIVMDLSMPLMNGIQAAEAIRKQSGSNSNTPIIALTADASEEARKKCIEAGMNDYLVKPIHPEQLAGAFDRVWQ